MNYDFRKEKKVTLIGPPAPELIAEDQLGDFDILPALNEYKELSSSPSTLLRLHSILLAEGEMNRAYLAAERYLESSESPEQKEAFLIKLNQKQITLPPVFIDIEKVQPLNITLTVPNQSIPNIDETEIEDLIRKGSGGQIEAKVSLLTSEESVSTEFQLATFKEEKDLVITSQSIDGVLTQNTLKELIYLSLKSLFESKDDTLELMPWSETEGVFEHGLTRLSWSNF